MLNRPRLYFCVLGSLYSLKTELLLLDEKFIEEDFVNTLSDTVTSFSELAKVTGLDLYVNDDAGTMTLMGD